MKKNAGFTLIELVAVMVILAILSVVAVPTFVDMRVQAANAGAAGVGGAIASGSALNYAKGVAGGGAQTVGACTAAALQPLVAGATVSGSDIVVGGRTYTIAGAATIANGAQGACTIEDTNPTAATAQNFTAIGCANATCS